MADNQHLLGLEERGKEREPEDGSRSCTPESLASTDLQGHDYLYGSDEEGEEELDESIEQTIAVNRKLVIIMTG